MILVDTSVWIDFFRDEPRTSMMEARLEAGDVVVHPWVVGELALGQRGARWSSALSRLRRLPAAGMVSDSAVLDFVETRALAGKGIGWVDAHLLASALAAGASLWTHDKRLVAVVRALGLDPR